MVKSMKLKYDCMEYLKKQDVPWVEYGVSKFLEKDEATAEEKKKRLFECTEVKETIEIVEQWPEPPLVRHNDVNHPIHKAHLLLEMGLDSTDKVLQDLANKIFEHQNEEGVFLSLLRVPESYGGAKEAHMDWLMCDLPLLIHFLLAVGYKGDERVQKGIRFLISKGEDNGWRCCGSIRKFRGPGRKTDYCPIGSLWSLQVFSLLPEYHNEKFVENAIDSICSHWRNTKERKIYMFAMGTDFKKLKYPNHWYDIIHVVQVLSKFEYAKQKEAYNEMLAVILNKQKEDGSFIPESQFTGYKGWDFGQKKISSPTLTLTIAKLAADI